MLLKRWTFKFCPFCECVGFKVNKKEQTFKCFACGAWGNHVVFYAMLNGVTVADLENAAATLKEMQASTR